MSEPFIPSSTLSSDRPPAAFTAFVPLLILGLVLLGWFGFQAMQLRVERDAMRAAIAAQDKPVQDSKKLRDALDALARGTAQLADAGNPNAKLVVDELKKHGVTIDPKQATTGATPPAPAVPAPAQ